MPRLLNLLGHVARHVRRDREPDVLSAVLGADDERVDPEHLPVEVAERTVEFPGLMLASVWRKSSIAFARKPRPLALNIPAVTV